MEWLRESRAGERDAFHTHILWMKDAKIIRPRRATPVLICRKCLKRSDDGKAIKRALKKQLKRGGGETAKPPRLISTSCFGICPKRAVVVASGKSLREGAYVLVSSKDEVATALRSL
jgi:hypothetical protein